MFVIPEKVRHEGNYGVPENRASLCSHGPVGRSF
jgi:hypothetical protein